MQEHTAKTSEFGKGFIYPIFLFAKHYERDKRLLKDGTIDYSMWFYAAADHMYEVDIPPQWEHKVLGIKAKELRDYIMGLRLPVGGHPEATKQDFIEVFERLEDLMLEIDKELGVEAIKATYN